MGSGRHTCTGMPGKESEKCGLYMQIPGQLIDQLTSRRKHFIFHGVPRCHSVNPVGRVAKMKPHTNLHWYS
jgi:hypothetical protein